MFGITRTYIINVIGPISAINESQVSYNKYPIVCITKRGIDHVWENEQVKESILDTVNLLGTENIEKSFVHVRIVDRDANISDEEFELKEIVEKWK